MDDAACHPFLNLFSLELGSYISLTNLSSRGHEISTSRTQWRGIYPGSRTAGDASMELQGMVHRSGCGILTGFEGGERKEELIQLCAAFLKVQSEVMLGSWFLRE